MTTDDLTSQSQAKRLVEMAVTSELLAESQELSQILQRLSARARDITGADFAAISVFGEGEALERFIYAGIDADTARRLGDAPVGRGLLGELSRWERPLRLDDLQSHPRFTGWPEGHPDMVAFLGVPLRAGGRTIGSFYMTRTRGKPPFSEDDELTAAILALQASVTVSHVLARERRGRISRLEERVRIAHDLHDGTIQALYAIGLQVSNIATADALPAHVDEGLSNTLDQVNDLIGALRQYITVLEAETPASEPELSRDLAFILRQLVPEGIDTVTNIGAAALQSMPARDVEDLLYIAREAVSNAVRHGAPSRLAVDLRQVDGSITLTVQDNGTGFDQARARIGLGSITMRTRAERLGADLRVFAIPGMGTTVSVMVPGPSPRQDDTDEQF